MLFAELRDLLSEAAYEHQPVATLSGTIQAVQRNAGLEATGALSAADVAVLRGISDDALAISIVAAKAHLSVAGYEVGPLDGDFDHEMELALMALSHDSGQAPDPELSLTNLSRLDDPPRRVICSEATAAGIPFRLSGAKALVEHAERLRPPRAGAFAGAETITGDPGVDLRIVERAVQRGYRLRDSATDTILIDAGIELDPRAVPDWLRMIDAAARDGVTMFGASGFRTLEHQQTLFVGALSSVVGSDLSSASITDAALDQVLDAHAPPGYSKHHTGFTVDIAAPGLALDDFDQSDAFRWLTDDDYANARLFGFVPSYPEGVDGLGPRPEPWEWVWIGADALFRCRPSPSGAS